MDTYSWLRELADSWVLLAMTAFYIGAILFVFRPGSRKAHDEAASIPLRNEKPKSSSCDGSCPDCRSATWTNFLKPEDA